MSKTILYLEDDEALAFITQRSLTKLGFEVQHAPDIPMFTTLLQNVQFDCVLLDLKIGHESSLGLIKKIKSKKEVPIVILSGYGTIRTAVQAMKLGAINFLSKPSSIDEILTAFDFPSIQAKQSRLRTTSVTDLDASVDDIQQPSLKALEWEAIQKALDDNEGNISAAARQLKMHRRTLQRKLQKRHLD